MNNIKYKWASQYLSTWLKLQVSLFFGIQILKNIAYTFYNSTILPIKIRIFIGDIYWNVRLMWSRYFQQLQTSAEHLISNGSWYEFTLCQTPALTKLYKHPVQLFWAKMDAKVKRFLSFGFCFCVFYCILSFSSKHISL